MHTKQYSGNLSANRPGLRSRFLGLLLVLCAVVLSACGADVNSQLNLRADYSGERIFVLTMADRDGEMLAGGVEAAEHAFETHLPEVLVFEGIEPEDEGYSATFRLSFENLEVYQRKITALLDTSKVPATGRDMTVEIDHQALTSSILFDESFNNDDLMGWAADALVAEAVVADSGTVFTSRGTATVVFDGQEIETSPSLPRMDFNFIEDRRFKEVDLDFEILDSGEVHIALSYLVSPEVHEAQNAFLTEQVEQLDELDDVAGQIADSGPVDARDGGAKNREIAATFTTADAVTKGMQILLANNDVAFEINEKTIAGSPDTSVQYVASNWTCLAICDPNTIQQLDGETFYPEHWELTEHRRDNGELILEFNRGLALNSLTSSTNLNFTGSITQTFEFVVDNEAQQGNEALVAEHFAPPKGAGSFETTTRDTTTIYTVSFEAHDAAALTSRLNRYLIAKDIDGQVALSHDPFTGIWASYDLQVDLSPIWELAAGGVNGAARFEVDLPAMHSGGADASVESGRTVVVDDSSGKFTVTASGPTVVAVWVTAILALLVAVIVTLWLRIRRSTTRHWAVASAERHSPRPYNVQGSKDELTETEIYASPLAPHADASETTRLPRGPDSHATQSHELTGPFPDVPLPSKTHYQRLQAKLDEPDQSSEDSSSASQGLSEDKSEREDGS